ncbi:TonB-dependent hemoglobin/transferrin/lactoferrin family receptor [Kistimonas scapharcae]|uniref:TonB-dependent hemoglobin/transferrin/lactoferrin family receptor n=1 Tax=Kistimonas scapharcae TaxID=1036133 RepID=A0ABP8UXK8_9GAMM
MKFKRTLLATAVMMATATQAMGEETVQTGKASMLDQVTVTATRTEKQLKDVAASVTVIDSEQIEKEMARNIKDLMRYEPGVNVGNDGRTGNKGFNIRGMDGNRVKIMVDGVDQSQAFYPGGDYLRSQRNFVDLDSIKAVEIVKGPASSLYGSDAIGGLVAFKTKDPADYLNPTGDDSYFSLKGAYTSADEGFAETITAANRTGDLETMIIFTRRDYKELETYGGADIFGSGRGEADPLDGSLSNVLAKAQYQLNDDHRIGLITEYRNQKSDIDVKSMSPDGVTGKDKYKRSRVGIFHEWDADVALFDSLQWQLDWQKTETDMQTRMPTYTVVFPPSMGGSRTYPNRLQKYNYEEDSYQFSAQFDKALEVSGLSHKIIYGLNAQKTDFKNTNASHNLDTGVATPGDYVPKVDATRYGIFLQDEIAVTDRLTVTPGVRYDTYKYKPSTTTGFTTENEKADDSKWTVRVGSVYELTEHLSVFGQFSQGFKAPDIHDMYHSETGTGRGYSFYANPDLKPEESNSFELGLRGGNHLGSFEVAAFLNKYKNFIEQVNVEIDPGNNPMGEFQKQNIAKAKIKGVEARSQLWLDEAINAPLGTSIKASIAYAKGEGKQDGEKTEPLNSVSPLKAVIGLAYDAPSETWGSEVTWTLSKGKNSDDISDNDDRSAYSPSGYGIVDLTAYYKPAKDLTFRAGLFNLTDKEYSLWEDVRDRDADYAGLGRFTQPGRNFAVSAKWEF